MLCLRYQFEGIAASLCAIPCPLDLRGLRQVSPAQIAHSIHRSGKQGLFPLTASRRYEVMMENARLSHRKQTRRDYVNAENRALKRSAGSASSGSHRSRSPPAKLPRSPKSRYRRSAVLHCNVPGLIFA